MTLKRYYSLKEKEKYYTCYTINSIADLQSEMSRFEGKRMVFRGVKEASYYNYPSALIRGIQLSQQEYDNLIAASIDTVWSNKRIEKLLLKQSDDHTDMQVLSLLQHYGFGTSILDFTYKFNHALFFALDGMTYSPEKYTDYSDINNYISIYSFDLDDVEFCTIQGVNVDSKDHLESFDQEAKRIFGSRYKGLSEGLTHSYSRMPYRGLARDFVSRGITIAGRYGGKMDIISPSTGLFVTYDISNDRSDTQYGLFILSPSVDEPYEVVALQNHFLSNKHLFCINIHKSLAADLKEHYLNPFCICKETMYPSTRFYNRIIRELLKIPFEERILPAENLVDLKPCTYKKLRRIAKKKWKMMIDANR